MCLSRTVVILAEDVAGIVIKCNVKLEFQWGRSLEMRAFKLKLPDGSNHFVRLRKGSSFQRFPRQYCNCGTIYHSWCHSQSYENEGRLVKILMLCRDEAKRIKNFVKLSTCRISLEFQRLIYREDFKEPRECLMKFRNWMKNGKFHCVKRRRKF